MKAKDVLNSSHRIDVTRLRLFQIINRKTGKRIGSYYDSKQQAKADRDPETMKVSVGPDHWRFKK